MIHLRSKTYSLKRNDVIYEKLVESDELPRTSQATPFAFTQVLAEKLGQPGEGGTDEVVIITLSAKLSGTYDSALAAAEPWGARVHVVDSTNVTVGEKALVAYAIRLVEQGMCASEVAAELNRVKGRIRLVALLDTLEYLQKGGRISKTVAIAGGMLSIKPVISILPGLHGLGRRAYQKVHRRQPRCMGERR